MSGTRSGQRRVSERRRGAQGIAAGGEVVVVGWQGLGPSNVASWAAVWDVVYGQCSFFAAGTGRHTGVCICRPSSCLLECVTLEFLFADGPLDGCCQCSSSKL